MVCQGLPYHFRRTAIPVVGLLAAYKVKMSKPATEVHRGFEHMISIRYQGSKVAAIKEDLRQGVLVRWYFVPAWRVMPMPPSIKVITPRKTPHTCEKPPPHLKSRLSLTESTIESSTGLMKCVKVWRLGVAVFLAGAYDVGAKRVKTDAYHIHCSLRLRKMLWMATVACRISAQLRDRFWLVAGGPDDVVNVCPASGSLCANCAAQPILYGTGTCPRVFERVFSDGWYRAII